ncbi:hypothetical protein ARAM_005192 [Aspergillus rambellii]|uniref:Nucleoside phosphorylase domain-containing protein n=1 Tax=Aspergillus rambellii TaxID=308745 RepID=A0A0F8VBS4_9EURO|nr:hypothetical protein ARAM_005192 [Aspergillus rambellii]
MAIVVNCFSQSATTAPRLTFENQRRIDFPLTKRESFESDGLESHLGGSLSPSQTPTTGPLSFRSYASSSTSDDLSSIDDSVEQVIIETLGPDSESNESQLTEDMKLVSSRVLVLASDVLHASEQEARTTNSFNSDTEHLIALICESPFDLAVLKAMIDVSQGRITGPSLEDDNTYELGLIADHKVLILCLHTGYLDGEGAAAAVMRMFQSFPSIRVGIMVGVGGGVPSAKNDIRRRDVVVGMSRSHGTASHLHFDFDNHATDPKKTSVVRLPTAIATAIAALEAECILGFRRILAILDETLPKYPALQERFRYAWSRTDFMFEAEYDCQGQSCAQCDLTRTLNRAERPSEDPVVHFGSIASCAQVLRDPHKRDELGKAYNILCFETNRSELRASFPLLVVRGIEGYCDTHHSPVWKAGAMATAAAWTKELLQTMPLPRA